MSLISDIESRVSNVEKYFDINTICKSGCTICTKIQKCTVNCSCLGSCNNSNEMNDSLFFKVWRNIVIRRTIIGKEMIEKLKPKNEVMDNVIENLKYYQINYDREFIFEEVKKLKDITDVKFSAELIVQPFFLKIMEVKEYQLSNALSSENLIVRLNSPRVKEYIQSIDPLVQSVLPSLFEIVEKEKQEINEILSNIQMFYELEDIEYQGVSETIRNFISRCNENYESLIIDELSSRYDQKKKYLTKSLEYFKIYTPKYQYQIDKYLNTHKTNEIKSNNVWSHNKIICKERYKYYKENHPTINLIKLMEELINHNIPYRENSEIIQNFINFLPPKQFFYKDYKDNYNCNNYNNNNYNYNNYNNNNNNNNDDDDFYYCLEEQFKSNGLSINDIVQHESDTIFSIIKILQNEFNSHGIQFNGESESIQIFISKTSSVNSDSFNKQLSSLLSIEKSFKIKLKIEEFKNQLLINGIQNPKYPEQHSKYLNSLCQFKDPSLSFNYNDDIWSPQTIIKKELEAISRINNLITCLSNVGITFQNNTTSNKLVNDYIYNRDKNGNQLSIEASVSLLNEIIKKEKEQQQDQQNQQEQQEQQDDDDDEYFEDYEDEDEDYQYDEYDENDENDLYDC
ncbi:hypothetical protein DDB_G0280615 [Dictyostelium discoideum AX4]|uniref:Uncharacterized protein n=1 Tax=Dictyostelium discoideum TaxID=44689 RepID=Q54V50_DICDI|nr:hypothetical protein DDB_G0280615 [Dictyostelium discoideum AX4]EAL67109.1 hypothetical protein DDB_G0280615 [Dictyostelium discoideum AX4]|eukprot:XP_641081.1 hypothetical protein DDB_G0280615 [Dictyostelium discoideum AX4]